MKLNEQLELMKSCDADLISVAKHMKYKLTRKEKVIIMRYDKGYDEENDEEVSDQIQNQYHDLRLDMIEIAERLLRI